MPWLKAGERTIESRLLVFDKDGTLVDHRAVDFELARFRRESVEKTGGNSLAQLWERTVGVDLKSREIDYNGPFATLPRREELLVATVAFYLNGSP